MPNPLAGALSAAPGIFLVPAGTFDVDVFVNSADSVPGAPTSVALRAAACIVIAE